MNKIFVIVLLVLTGYVSFACPACEKLQHAFLKGITHGAGPDGKWDYVIVTIAVFIVLVTLFFSVKWLVKPGEQSQSHIKRLVLNNE
ncbi:MAG TPA: hypothetical protein VLM16_04335 [Ginsengibacter sp.]|nr:hypothetical protein [Ginsengibacter sp.]